jgi:hypothetical protein
LKRRKHCGENQAAKGRIKAVKSREGKVCRHSARIPAEHLVLRKNPSPAPQRSEPAHREQKRTRRYCLVYLGDTKAQIQAAAITTPYIVSVYVKLSSISSSSFYLCGCCFVLVVVSDRGHRDTGSNRVFSVASREKTGAEWRLPAATGTGPQPYA